MRRRFMRRWPIRSSHVQSYQRSVSANLDSVFRRCNSPRVRRLAEVATCPKLTAVDSKNQRKPGPPMAGAVFNRRPGSQAWPKPGRASGRRRRMSFRASLTELEAAGHSGGFGAIAGHRTLHRIGAGRTGTRHRGRASPSSASTIPPIPHSSSKSTIRRWFFTCAEMWKRSPSRASRSWARVIPHPTDWGWRSGCRAIWRPAGW